MNSRNIVTCPECLGQWVEGEPMNHENGCPHIVGQDELLNRFTYHPPQSDDIEAAYRSTRNACHAAAVVFVTVCPESRELSLAIRKLEEAVMWANAGIARRS